MATTIHVSATDDSEIERNETFLLQIDEITGPAMDATSFTVITITDNDSKLTNLIHKQS